MSDKLELGTRVRVTDSNHDGDKGTVVACQGVDTYLVYVDDTNTPTSFFRSEIEVYVKPVSQRIIDRDALVALQKTLNIGADWHEPDDEITVEVRGKSFDNAGFWDDDHAGRGSAGKDHEELHVAIFRDGDQIATVNLATLFSWATGWNE